MMRTTSRQGGHGRDVSHSYAPATDDELVRKFAR
jgi:hypothetical protein